MKNKNKKVVKRRFFNSLRGKLTFAFILVIILFVGLTVLACNMFMVKYYQLMVERMLNNMYTSINEMVGDCDESEEIYETLSNNFYTDNNVDIVIGEFEDQNRVNLDYSTSSDGYMGRQSMEMLFKLAADAESSEGDTDSEWKFNFSKNYVQSSDATANTSSYFIQRTRDNITGADFYDLVGKLDNGHVIVIQTPLESIRNSVKICNTFLIYVAALVVFISLFVMFFLTRHFTKPILNMAHVADRMTHLDFDAKIDRFTNDEVGDLGRNMNAMSDKLQETISNLKTANAELQKDIEKKEEIEEMRSEFISNVSHELKTPIALIQGYAEGLKDNVLDDDESKEMYCDVIIDEASRMNKLVRNLLTLNELENGRDQVQIERFDIKEMIVNVASMADIMIQKNEVDLQIDIPDNTYVWADEFKIEGVITNYLNNAINHASGEKMVKISCEHMDNNLRVYVYNDGENIPEDTLDKLWEKFYKVDKARTREYGGNGIGLSIVAATMKAHGKDFGVYNVETGVVFYFDVDTVNFVEE